MKTTLSNWDIDAIVRGVHPNPFSVLGCHGVKGKKVAYRVFRPGAKRISIHTSGNEIFLHQIHEQGLFEGLTSGKQTQDYEVSVDYDDTITHRFRDPYSFSPGITSFDLQLWGEGNHVKSWKFMGAHYCELEGVLGTHFIVSAPSASRVSVVGSFNHWDGRVHCMRRYYEQGLWEIFIPEVHPGQVYKYEISSPHSSFPVLKSDPYGQASEVRPNTASIVTGKSVYTWNDSDWLLQREQKSLFDQPLSIYELHLGSWRRATDRDPAFLTYREIADQLVPYIVEMGYTHVEILPITEHPYDPSWGYQTTGYYAPTSRYGTADDLRYFVDRCHQSGIGVILDWVPAHFAKDAHGLRMFDGTHLYEHADPRQGEHRDWGTLIFNFGRTEVVNFLLSNALYWCEEFHIDGLRVDAVASMLYLDYSRNDGDWIPNKYGGRENLEAIQFLKRFNEVVHEAFPGCISMAEESTSWPMVSKPSYLGGLGFDFKWNMGWMNDTLEYIQKDPIHRKYHHHKLTFSMMYAFSENFVLPFSHDEVVHLKKAMLTKMPGDEWQRFANLRILYAYQYAHPGKKLLFMGSEFGQWGEWNSEEELHWALLGNLAHAQLKDFISTLNQVYRTTSSLFEVDFDWTGFQWIDLHDADHSILSFARYSKNREQYVICIFNFTPVVYHDYKVGVPDVGMYKTLINSDDNRFGGSGIGSEIYHSKEGEMHGQPAYLPLMLPPLGAIILEKQS